MSSPHNREEVASCQDATPKQNKFARTPLSADALQKAQERILQAEKKKAAKADKRRKDKLAKQGAVTFGAQHAQGQQPTKGHAGPSLSYQWAERVLAGVYGDFAYDESGKSGVGTLFRWNAVYWEEMSHERFKQLCSDWLYKNHPDKAKASHSADATTFALETLALQRKLPRNEGGHIMAVQNAYLHINDAGDVLVQDPDPLLGLTHACRAVMSTAVGSIHVPQPVPSSSLWGRYLASSVPDLKEQDLLQEMAAMTFLPACYRKAICLYGIGSNGKDVYAQIVAGFHANPVVTSLNTLGATFGLESIVGASLIVVNEVKRGRFDEEVFKPLVSGDPVQVNRKHLKSLPMYQNRAKFLITAQDPLFITDNSNGVHERLCTMEFKVVIPEDERIPDLAKRILKEEPHIFLDWLLVGMKRLLARGAFPRENELPESVLRQKRALRIQYDQVGAWIDDMGVEHNPESRMSKEAVHSAFVEWCISDGRKPLEPNAFWRELWRKTEFTPHAQKNLYSQDKVSGKRTKLVEISITGISNPDAGQSIKTQSFSPVADCEITF